MTDDALLTVDQVADRLQANPETIRRWLRSGRLRGSRPGGTRAGWRVRASELRRLTGGAEQDAVETEVQAHATAALAHLAALRELGMGGRLTPIGTVELVREGRADRVAELATR